MSSTYSPAQPIIDPDEAESAAARHVGRKLRDARLSRNLTLAAVEATSDGEFKASCVGAYERGDRAVTIGRLARLADLYGVSMLTLIPGGEAELYSVKLVGNIGEAHRIATDLVAELGSVVGHYAR